MKTKIYLLFLFPTLKYFHLSSLAVLNHGEVGAENGGEPLPCLSSIISLPM